MCDLVVFVDMSIPTDQQQTISLYLETCGYCFKKLQVAR